MGDGHAASTAVARHVAAVAVTLALPTACIKRGRRGPSSWWCCSRPAARPDIIGRLVAEPLAAALGSRWWSTTSLARAATRHRHGRQGRARRLHAVLHHPGSAGHRTAAEQGAPYDPARELAPVTLVAMSPNLLVVDPKLGANTLADFVRVAKAKGGALNYGSVGNGSARIWRWSSSRAAPASIFAPCALPGLPAGGERHPRRPCRLASWCRASRWAGACAAVLRGPAVSTLAAAACCRSLRRWPSRAPLASRRSRQAVFMRRRRRPRRSSSASARAGAHVRSDELRAKMLAVFSAPPLSAGGARQPDGQRTRAGHADRGRPASSRSESGRRFGAPA